VRLGLREEEQHHELLVAQLLMRFIWSVSDILEVSDEFLVATNIQEPDDGLDLGGIKRRGRKRCLFLEKKQVVITIRLEFI
jgi:hypothetical protein